MNDVIERAIASFPAFFDRASVLRGAAHLLRERAEELASTMAREVGKPIKEGVGEVEYAASFFDWFATMGEAMHAKGSLHPAMQRCLMVRYDPIGVAALITPWNFPLAMPAKKVAAALAAGCSAILVPSPKCPESAENLLVVLREAGLPENVLQVIYGPPSEVGQKLVDDPRIAKISFTGSVAVGKVIYQSAAKNLKRLTLELGGHAPFLVFADADLERVVEGAVVAKLRNSGQTCVAPNRFLVQEPIYDQFLDALFSRLKTLQVGDPLDPRTDLSNRLDPTSVEKVEAHVADAVEKGAHLLEIGKEPYFPKILDQVSEEMLLWREETFGPVCPLRSFATEEEALSLANDSEYGLISYVFSQNIDRCHRVVERLDYGIVGVNDALPSSAPLSFGGRKSSGFGREGGFQGIFEYLQEKAISLKPALH